MSRADTHDDVFGAFGADPAYRKEMRRLRPYYDLVVEIVNRRSELGLTQKELAELARTYQSRISKIESAEHDIRFSTLIEIAEALSCEVSVHLDPIVEPKFGYSDKDYLPLFTSNASTGQAQAISTKPSPALQIA